MEISFLYPKLLFLLLLVPLFILIYFLSFAYNKKKTMIFANFSAMRRFYDMEFFSKNFISLYIFLAILVLLIFSVSGIGLTMSANSDAFSYVIAIDNSRSMSATDVSPDRLSAAKTEAKNFVDLLPVGVEVGVIGFSGEAVVLQELDNSKIKIKMAIDSIDYGSVAGTSVYNGLLSANKLFGSRQMKSVIVISDGQDNVANTPEIIRFINQNNLVVNTIAVGTEDGGNIAGVEVVSKLNEDFLKALAFNSGGKYFLATSAETMRSSFESIFYNVTKNVTIDLSMYCLFAAILLLTLLWVLNNFRFKVIP